MGTHYMDRYLGGVLDFTGELNRYAVAKATVRDVQEVKRCRDITEALMGEFLQARSALFPLLSIKLQLDPMLTVKRRYGIHLS